jgi:predicted RNase H-like HicB family nuclease
MSVFTAVVSQGEEYLVVHVPEIDQWTQARDEAEVEPMARDLIALWLDVPESEVEVDPKIGRIAWK